MSEANTTWRLEIKKAMRANGETFDDLEYCTLSAEGLDKGFDVAPQGDFGLAEGQPCDEAKGHVGDGF